MQLAQRRPSIVVITSLVSRGAVGGRGVVFALERLGFPVWFVPTVTLPWHPGHGPATRIVPPPRDFAATLDDLAGAPWLDDIGAVMTGYLGGADQAEAIDCFVTIARERNPELLYLCDPIAGDKGDLYVPQATAAAIGDMLLPAADIATPNMFELGWFTGREIATTEDAVAAARVLGPERVLVTSMPGFLRNTIGNLLVSRRGAVQAEHTAIAGAPHGPGDLLAALFLARILDGRDEEAALGRAAASTFELVARTVKRGDDELAIAAEQIALEKPMAMVTMRRVAEKRSDA